VLEGDRYGSVERTVETVSGLRGEEGERVRVLLEWLKREM